MNDWLENKGNALNAITGDLRIIFIWKYIIVISMSIYLCFVFTQQTQNVCITFVQCRPNVFDAGPTLYKCHTNVLRLLGYCFHIYQCSDVLL